MTILHSDSMVLALWWIMTSVLQSAGWTAVYSFVVSAAVFAVRWVKARDTVDDYACTAQRSRFAKQCIVAGADTLQWWSRKLQFLTTALSVAALGIRASTGMLLRKTKPAPRPQTSVEGMDALLTASIARARKVPTSAPSSAPICPEASCKLPPGVQLRPAIRAPPLYG